MRLRITSSAWWGPPKNFDKPEKDRRVSWLELFYDLVYVIAISRITHHLSAHISFSGFIEYAFLFMLIFWGWLNGSLYHDLHGNSGLRTRLMTLWQMMIIAALAITIDQPSGKGYTNMTIIFMIMQIFITYLWWSVGFYDPRHRKYNRPYTILYLLSLGWMGLSLLLPPGYLVWIVPMIILLNYLPPFITNRVLHGTSFELNLSSSMAERLGLFMIIIFGEVVLGVVNGISNITIPGFTAWLNFALALSIVFSLWWLFFTLISKRKVKKGFLTASLLEILYLPALMSLGLIGSCFSLLFTGDHEAHSLHATFGWGITIFITSISLMLGLIKYPTEINSIKKPFRVSLLITAFLFFILTFFKLHFPVTYFLFLVIAILLFEILYLNSRYYALNVDESQFIDDEEAEIG